MRKNNLCLVAITAALLCSAPQVAAFENADFTRAAEATVNSVVSIKSYIKVSQHHSRSSANGYFNPFENDPFFQYFFGQQPRQQPRQQPDKQSETTKEPQYRQSGLGSGVILDTNGLIVTNNHVIDKADRLEVTLNDNRTFDATVVGTDPATDLAVIRIEADNLAPIVIGDSEALKVGEWVLAVGNPFGLTSTVTAGIVSAKARNVSINTGSQGNGIESYIQTDAAVNPGNSGGALVNLSGELVGINSAIYSQTGNYAGNSFAVPTTIMRKVVDDIKAYGAVQRAVLGIRYAELTPSLVKEKGITATASGIYVGQVEENSAAADAGIKEGDVIIAINGQPTTTTGIFQETFAKHSPGDIIFISFYRDNQLMSTEVKLRNTAGTLEVVLPGNVSELGCSFKKVDDATCKELRIPSGLQVANIGDGRFKNAGIKDNFIIVDINNVYVTSADEVKQLYDAIVSSTEYDHVMFISGVYPGSPRKVFYAVDLGHE